MIYLITSHYGPEVCVEAESYDFAVKKWKLNRAKDNGCPVKEIREPKNIRYICDEVIK